MRRTHATINAKAPRSARVEAQLRTDEHGTPALWVCAEGSAPVALVGHRAISELHDALGRLLGPRQVRPLEVAHG